MPGLALSSLIERYSVLTQKLLLKRHIPKSMGSLATTHLIGYVNQSLLLLILALTYRMSI